MVEEIPSYSPCGSGEHLYLTIEKRGITTLEAVRTISRSLGVSEADMGYAGMKDSIGITRQTISLRGLPQGLPEDLELPAIRIIAASRHTNKLKTGHLKGNRFKIVVRGIAPDACTLIGEILSVLTRRGVPNYYGYQRYGVQANSHLIGAAMLQGDGKSAVGHLMGDASQLRDEQWRAAISAYHRGDMATALELIPRHCRSEREVLRHLVRKSEQYDKAFTAVHPRLRKLYLNAFQSFLFDQVVARRLDSIDRCFVGDVAFKHDNGACFLVEDEQAELERVRTLAISPTGPLFGAAMKQPEGLPLQMEQELLAQQHVTFDDFSQPGKLRLEGERRPLRIPLGEPDWHVRDTILTLSFSLPKGSYATSVLREICKSF